jgi:hypothetical protein
MPRSRYSLFILPSFFSFHHCITASRVHLFSSLEGETFVLTSFLLASSLPRVISSFPRVLFLTSSLSLHLCLPTESPSFSYVSDRPTRYDVLPRCPSTIANENSMCAHYGQSLPISTFTGKIYRSLKQCGVVRPGKYSTTCLHHC